MRREIVADVATVDTVDLAKRVVSACSWTEWIEVYQFGWNRPRKKWFEDSEPEGLRIHVSRRDHRTVTRDEKATLRAVVSGIIAAIKWIDAGATILPIVNHN